MLKKARRERIKERKVDLEKRSDYNALEMKDVKEIMGHDEKHLRTLANNFLRTPGYYGQTRSRLMESLEEGIEDVERNDVRLLNLRFDFIQNVLRLSDFLYGSHSLRT